MIDDENPFTSPQAASGPNAPALNYLSDAEKIREVHHVHELSIKSIGFVYYVIALICGLACFSYWPSLICFAFLGISVVPPQFLIGGFVASVTFVFATLATGYGLRRLKSRARIPAIILSTMGLLMIPIGTLVNLYFLYLLCSQKGQIVFTEEYQEVIRQTPHMKRRTSATAWITLALIGSLVAAAYLSRIIF